MQRAIVFSALVLGLTGCGGDDDGGLEGGAGQGGGGAGGGVSLGGGGGNGGDGGVGAVGGSASGGSGAEGGTPAGGGGGGGTSGGCNNDTKHATIGNLIVADVSWPAKTGISAGSGKIHIWTRTSLDFADPSPSGEIAATGEVTPCGSSIPALTKTSIAGGGQVQTVIPDAVWDKPGMPKFKASGTLSGFDVGATIAMDPVVSLVGLNMADPNAAWPTSAKQIQGVDHDGDGKPGILAVPRTDPPFSAPPTSLFEALNPSGKRAVEVYIVTRTAVQISGTRDSCTSASGQASVKTFDSHVVGCKRNDGQACSGGESDFIDQNQPKFSVSGASYKMVQLTAGATCADVRAALPM